MDSSQGTSLNENPMGMSLTQKERLMSGESVVIEREGLKEFVPAVQPNIFKEGTIENKHML
jgi:hypothetical protein